MDQDFMWFHEVPPGTNNFGTKALRVNETGPSYEVNASPATVVQQAQMEQYYMSALSECLDSPNVADQHKLRRGAYEVAGDPERRKLKKEIDKAYRERCKEKKMIIEETLTVLTKENDKVKRENSQLRKEEVRLQGIVQAQNESMKQLQREFGQLKDQLDRQNMVVEVLSKQLASCKDINLQRENKQLRLEKDSLMKQIRNKDSLNMFQLEAKNTKLEQEKNALQLIIDALCAKINRDNKHDPD